MLTEVVDIILTGKTVTFDYVFSVRKGYKRQHSPKFRDWYTRSNFKIQPKAYLHAISGPIEQYCFEFVWQPDINLHTPEGHRKLATWCHAQRTYLGTDSAEEIAKKSNGRLSTELVEYYLSFPGRPLG